jgi:hypothetical protein
VVRRLKFAAVAALALNCAACAGSVTQDAALDRGDQPSLVVSEDPQGCAAYAREHSGVALYGDAYTWWDQAAGRYGRADQPQRGAVLVLAGYAGPKHSHVAVVTRVVSDREIRVDHANWLNDGNIYLNTPVIDVSPDNTWSEVRVWNTRDGHFGGNTYAVQGFIVPYSTTASVVVPGS